MPKGRLNVPTASGHMLMLSAQHWTDNQCCRCIPHVLIMRHQLAATALVPPSETWEMWYKVLHTDLFTLHGIIRPGNKTSSVYFGA